MKKMSLEAICEQILKCQDQEGTIPDFETFCGKSGVSHRAMNNKFYETFGMSGDDVMARIYSSYT